MHRIAEFFQNLLTRLFGSRNSRLLRQYSHVVQRINALEPEMEAASDDDHKQRTEILRSRIRDGASLEAVLPAAFAAVREASRRTLGLRHFDVQLIGGMVLHEGKIAEMRTGEGKTLVATLPAYLNALGGRSVHIVTVNEYLAGRDADWMRPIYEFLGLSVSVIKSGQSPDEKREVYEADITYGTNNEFGFDYLRDNLAFRPEHRAQRDLTFAVVDEVDSILIDEARTPLIISGASDESTELYERINKLVPKLTVQTEEDGAGDYTLDEKAKQAYLTEEGHQKVEKLMVGAGMLNEGESLYDAANIRLMHHLMAALRAHAIFSKDIDYIVKDGEIVIVDEFTGRTMPGRRWSDGLHQAVEAKEGVTVKQESQTVASITFQNYFRMYDTLAGMTGTADTEAFEFQQIYGLEVVVIPTHMPMIRDDAHDLVYLTKKDKFDAIIGDIEECREKQTPVLVGTTSIETSEFLSGVLKKRNIPHNVLNAKHHAQEAEIIIGAGRPGKVTIATNMAGRGTDIVLGGKLTPEMLAGDDVSAADKTRINEEWQHLHNAVVDSGGLHIIGTERHESRRIDNQLRGRSGRQGDPGSSRFYLSMEDNLMRIFGDPDRTKSLLERVGMREGEAIESKMLTRQIEKAQRKVEARNFDMRKALLEYDDVSNDQRRVVYEQRTELMKAEDVEDAIYGIREEVVNVVVDAYIPPGSVEEQWDTASLEQALEREFAVKPDVRKWLEDDDTLNEDALRKQITQEVANHYDEKVRSIGTPIMRNLEKAIMLQQLDMNWKEHLAALEYLRQGIHLRSFAQKNPKQEYKREAFQMFSDMLDRVKHDTISLLSKIQVRSEEDVAAVDRQRQSPRSMRFRHASASAIPAGGTSLQARPQAPEQQMPFVRVKRKVGRNEPCPCGSGKKYKLCHGKLT